jgi:tetratricopeptide (TPR) repeat protein
MYLHKLAPIAAGAAALFAVSFDANAAVTILGNNTLAQNCYLAAEVGGDAQFGIQTCSTALDTQPLTVKDRAATLVNRGILRAEIGDSAGALADYNHGIQINPELGEAYVDRGATLISMKKWSDAVTDINKGLALSAKRPYIAYYDRAIADEALGDVRSAYDDYKKAVELEPGFTLATEQLTRFRVIKKSDDGT